MGLTRHIVGASLLRENAHYRRVLVARTISLLGLGLLAVSLPVQVFALTGSSFHVGLVLAIDGAGLFLGILLGGVLADLHDRRRLILFARGVCGLGFVGLALNSLMPAPSLAAIYLFAGLDGFFGALGVAGLMAALPGLVGRDRLMQAGALGMLSARVTNIAAPALGGLVIAWGGVSWNYALTAAATLLTVLTLLPLPPLRPEPSSERPRPVAMLGEALGFVATRRRILVLFGFGAILALAGAMRGLFPALIAGPIGGGGAAAGLLYAAVPVGAALGAGLSGWAAETRRPVAAMVALCLLAAGAVAAVGAAGHLAAALAALVVYGYAVAIAGLLQYAMLQRATPDNQLGRVNALWVAQESLGEIGGALLIGGLAGLLLPGAALMLFGAGLAALAATLALATGPGGEEGALARERMP